MPLTFKKFAEILTIEGAVNQSHSNIRELNLIVEDCLENDHLKECKIPLAKILSLPDEAISDEDFNDWLDLMVRLRQKRVKAAPDAKYVYFEIFGYLGISDWSPERVNVAYNRLYADWLKNDFNKGEKDVVLYLIALTMAQALDQESIKVEDFFGKILPEEGVNHPEQTCQSLLKFGKIACLNKPTLASRLVFCIDMMLELSEATHKITTASRICAFLPQKMRERMRHITIANQEKYPFLLEHLEAILP